MFVTGGSGLLGNKLVRELTAKGYEVVALYNTRKPSDDAGAEWYELDVRRTYVLEDLILKKRPEVVVHAAAYTDVDGCEREKRKAWQVNVEATKSVVRAAKVVNAYLVYVSTDYVFDGEKGLYKEDDIPNPVNYYGLTKLMGEELVRSSELLYTIVRPSATYGVGGSKKSFAEYVAEKVLRGEEVSALIDQHVSPTYNVFLAQNIAKIIEMRVLGTIHVAGDRMSRYEFALKIAEELGASKSLVKAVRMHEMEQWVAKRPRDSSLDTAKAKEILGDFHCSEKAIKMFAYEFMKTLIR